MKPSSCLVLGLLAVFARQHGSAATFSVTTTSPDGPGSLGQAILDANATPGADLIHFGIPGAGPHTITLSAALPPVTEAVTLDATTQPDAAGIPPVTLDGNFKRNVSGLVITATGCTVRGLAIINCGTSGGSQPMWGLVLQGGGQHRIEGCYIGLDPDGVTAKRNRDGGILLSNSVDNVIGGLTAAARNVISGNSASGVVIAGASASNNVVAGNFIGLTAAGTAKLANGTFALRVQDGASANRIGGTEIGARNVIVGNNGTTLEIAAGTTGTRVQGNFIGLRADGEALGATPSSSHGVAIRDSAGNVVGGTAAGAGNVLSGNQFAVLINGAGASNNVVQGNLIGTDPTGKAARPNHLGVSVGGGATGNVIGGPEAGARNLISANVTDGVSLNGASRNRVQGNFIGTDLTGNVALGNGRPNGGSAGVTVAGVAGPTQDNLIGGDVAERNIIAGNVVSGIAVVGTFAERTRIQANFIGLGSDGTTPLGNQADGIQVLGATDTWIGTPPTATAPGPRQPGRSAPPTPLPGSANFIYANLNNGIAVRRTFGETGAGATGTAITDNLLFGNLKAGISELVGAFISRNIILPPAAVPLNWQPIDWKGDGVSNPNAPDNTVNFPVIVLATFNPATSELLVKGHLQVPAAVGLPTRLEFFAIPDVVPGLQRTFAGFEKALTDGSGNQSFELRVPFAAFVPKSVIGVAIVGGAAGQFETGQESPPTPVAPDAPCSDIMIRLHSGSLELGVITPESTLPYYPPAAHGLSVTAEGGTPPYQIQIYANPNESDKATGTSLPFNRVAAYLSVPTEARLFFTVSDSKGCHQSGYFNMDPVNRPVGFRHSETGALQVTWPAFFGRLNVELTHQLGPQAVWLPIVDPVRFVDGDLGGIEAPAVSPADGETYYRALFP